jgi:uncharacterized membrane protein YpjA
MRKYLRILLFGFLAWLVPFAASIPFYSAEGQPTVDIFLMKSIMIVVGSLSGAFLLVVYFRYLTKSYVAEGILVGLLWFAINILLDVIVLVPMMQVPFSTYFAQIGMRYLVMPVMSTAIGLTVQKKCQEQS